MNKESSKIKIIVPNIIYRNNDIKRNFVYLYISEPIQQGINFRESEQLEGHILRQKTDLI